ncbi:MAG: hypothetical protein HOP15_09835 [Planctomycetes bacterium]|nr:hypothetical protein [Planctomycetota bacterium]
MTKHLYTETSVRELPVGAELVLGKDAIATPAALELAFARGIRVRYGDGTSTPGSSSSAASPADGDLWKLLAEDGEYVVQVKAGHARVFRLGGAGPVLVGEAN